MKCNFKLYVVQYYPIFRHTADNLSQSMIIEKATLFGRGVKWATEFSILGNLKNNKAEMFV